MVLQTTLGNDEYFISSLRDVHLSISDLKTEKKKKNHNKESCLTLRCQIFNSVSFIFHDHLLMIMRYTFGNAALKFQDYSFKF